MLKINRYIFSQILSFLYAMKYRNKQCSTTFCTDVFFVPLSCFLLCVFKIKQYKERNMKGGLIAGLLYFASVFSFVIGSNTYSMEFSLLVRNLGLLIAYALKFLFSDKFFLPPFPIVIYFLITIGLSVIILWNDNISGMQILHSFENNLSSILFSVGYNTVTNMFTNEIGVIQYFAYSSYISPLLFVVLIRIAKIGHLYDRSLYSHIYYYLLSFSIYVLSVFYIQLYGIVTFNYLHIGNLVIYLLLKNYDIEKLRILYIVLTIANIGLFIK